MFRDCLRCGYGWHTKHRESMPCPCCSKMSDETAAYVKEHRMVRVIGEIKDWQCPNCKQVMDVKVMANSAKTSFGLNHFH